MQVDSCKTIFGVSLPRKVMVDELGSQELVTITSETSSQKFGGMYNGEQAWSACGWFRKELRKRTTVMAVVGKVLYVHAPIEPAYLDAQMVRTAGVLDIAGPTGPRSYSFPLVAGHHPSTDGFTQYSLTDNSTGKVTDSAWAKLGASMILKRRRDDDPQTPGPGDESTMTPENREKLFNQIDIETWKEMESPYCLCLGAFGSIFSPQVVGV